MLTHQSGVRLLRGIVKGVQPNKIILDNGEEVPYGFYWYGQRELVLHHFVKSLHFPKSPGGR
jgi:NADH:ubiquinone reductase (non-electrogenic)